MDDPETSPATEPLAPDEYYFEGDLLVLTEKAHLRRGHCCFTPARQSRCRHCPNATP